MERTVNNVDGETAEEKQVQQSQAAMQRPRALRRIGNDLKSIKPFNDARRCVRGHGDVCLTVGVLVGGLTIAGALYRKSRKSQQKQQLRTPEDGRDDAADFTSISKHVTWEEDVRQAVDPCDT